MNLNVNEYREKRLADIRYYLRGINYNNLNSNNAIEKLSGDIDAMFNRNTLYRRETNKFVVAVNNAYYYLKDDKLEFANSVQEIDKYIEEFEKKLKQIIVDFKNNILNIFKEETGYQPNTINNSLDFIKIKIRDKNERLTADELHDKNELNGLREIVNLIYTFICMIKDKRFKSENILDLVNMKYSVRDAEYIKEMKKYLEILNEQDYDKFIILYEESINRLNGNSKSK